MGKMALLLVLGLSVTIGIMSYTINRSKGSLGENVSGFDRYVNGRNLSHTGVNMMLRQLDRDPAHNKIWDSLSHGRTGLYIFNMATINRIAAICSVTVKRKAPSVTDTLILSSRAHYMDSVYTMKLTLKSYPKPFPSVNAALGIASDSMNFTMSGNPHIYGENYDMDGTRGNSAYDTNGVSVISTAESTWVTSAGGTRITGDPQATIISPPDNPIAYVPEYIAGADTVFANGSSNNGNYGTAAAPIIAYADGNVKFGGSGTFYGVLVVHGTLDFKGTFDMYCLVIAYGDATTINVSTSAGTPQIYGGVIVTGPKNSSFTMKGTADVRYSVEALAMAKNIGKLQAYKILSWYETDR